MELPVNYNLVPYYQKRLIREEYVKIQEGKCYYCGESLNNQPSEKICKLKINKHLFPKGFFDWPIHLHHNHETGMTIGAVHCICNAVLWEYHEE
jgi:hypothetical protein